MQPPEYLPFMSMHELYGILSFFAAYVISLGLQSFIRISSAQ